MLLSISGSLWLRLWTRTHPWLWVRVVARLAQLFWTGLGGGFGCASPPLALRAAGTVWSSHRVERPSERVQFLVVIHNEVLATWSSTTRGLAAPDSLRGVYLPSAEYFAAVFSKTAGGKN